MTIPTVVTGGFGSVIGAGTHRVVMLGFGGGYGVGLGGRHIVSQRSGFRVKAEDLVKDPDARIWVHRDEVDEVNPQDFVRGRRDKQRVRRGFPEPDDRFLSTNEVTRESL